MFRYASVLLFGGLLSACAGAPPARAEFPPGSAIVLNRPVTIPADRASVWIQDGAVTAYSAVDKYRPHCRFEVRSLESTPRTVQPGRFAVRRVQREIEGLLGGGFAPVAAFGVFGVFGADGGPSPTPYITRLYLRSAEQPDVRSLACQQWEDSTLGSSQHLTMAEFRNALGDLFTVQAAS